MAKTPLLVGGGFFLIISLVHLSRLVFKFEVTVGSSHVPLWINGVGFVVTVLLACWLLKTAKKV